MIALREESVTSQMSLDTRDRDLLACFDVTKALLEREPASSASTSRQTQWAASRRAVAHALRDHPRHRPLSVSIAHTSKRAQAALQFETQSFETKSKESPAVRVGVDIEERGRTLSPRLISRLMNANEAQLCSKLDPLAVWVLKEAVFKALPGELQSPLPSLILSGLHAETQGTWWADFSHPQPLRARLESRPEHWLAVCEFSHSN